MKAKLAVRALSLTWRSSSSRPKKMRSVTAPTALIRRDSQQLIWARYRSLQSDIRSQRARNVLDPLDIQHDGVDGKRLLELVRNIA